MTRPARPSEKPFDPDAPPSRLPIVGGPLDDSVYDEGGRLIKRGRTRAAEGLSFRKAGWRGEYRRTATAWQWTPDPGKEDTVTERVNTARLVSHPSPAVMANHAENVAKRVRRDGVQVSRRASVLASRGLPIGTSGATSRSPGSQDTSVERAVGVAGEADEDAPSTLTPPDPEWIGVDAELAKLHRAWWALGDRILGLYDRVLSHAGDDDPIPAGTGSCSRCEKFCRPTAEQPNNRIRSSLCPACHRKWVRLGKPDKAMFRRMHDEDAA